MLVDGVWVQQESRGRTVYVPTRFFDGVSSNEELQKKLDEAIETPPTPEHGNCVGLYERD